jgi:hypothetical protein
VLRSLRELEATLVRVNRLAALQRIYAGAVPEDLVKRSRVVLEQAGSLVVVADTSAMAHKLRQLAPRIVEQIVKFAPEVTSIVVEVQVTPGSDLRARRDAAIGPRGLTSLRQLCDKLPESPLREALARMIQRGSRSDSQNESLEDKKSNHDQGKDQ